MDPQCWHNNVYPNVTLIYKNIKQDINLPYLELLHAAIKSKHIYELKTKCQNQYIQIYDTDCVIDTKQITHKEVLL